MVVNAARAMIYSKGNIMRYLLSFCVALLLLVTSQAKAHCEIPCGIFDDAARFDTLEEHARTIEKAMVEINRLSASDTPDFHTIARWTATKEEHAKKVQQIVAIYFFAQRVKIPPAEADQADYIAHTTLLHRLMVAAMKTKQSTDVQRVEQLRDAVQAYKNHYFKQHGHQH